MFQEVRILLTGGGTGGHVYPAIAVAESLHDRFGGDSRLKLTLRYIGQSGGLEEREAKKINLPFRGIRAGKLRRYFALANLVDMLLLPMSILTALWEVYKFMPDYIFGKGGYVTFPVAVAGYLLRIPLIIHESDAVAGLANLTVARFAKTIAVSYPHTAASFGPYAKKCVLTGVPMRKGVRLPHDEASARGSFSLDPNLPVLLVIGGSQGAKALNEVVVEALPTLLKYVQVIHLAGTANEKEVRELAILATPKELLTRYYLRGELTGEEMARAYAAATVVLSRAGSMLFEVAAWGKPAIVVPLPSAASDHQRKNAAHFDEARAAIVIEQSNLLPALLTDEVTRLLADPNRRFTLGTIMHNAVETEGDKTIAEILYQESVKALRLKPVA